MSKIALFFGSFNPVHYGHISIAEYVLNNTDADKVIMIVSPNNPFKGNIDSAERRLEDARKAIASTGLEIEVSDIEFHLPQPLYTIQTLNYLSNSHPENEYILVIGGDNAESLERWFHGQEIIENYTVWVYPRPGYDAKAAIDRYCKNFHPKGIVLFDAVQYDISSTQIRNGE